MSVIKHAIIAAAGLGSRLGMDMPKSLVHIGSHKVIYYLLELLKDIPDLRVIVGFQEHAVMDYVKNIRPDVIFVRNPQYLTTSTAYSVNLATKDLKEPFLLVDGDLLINKQEFGDFLKNCDGKESLLGLTRCKTDEPVSVRLEGDKIVGFSRESDVYEWSGIAYLKGIKIDGKQKYIFEEIEQYLPLRYFEIECYEVDTLNDLHNAVINFHSLGYD